MIASMWKDCSELQAPSVWSANNLKLFLLEFLYITCSCFPAQFFCPCQAGLSPVEASQWARNSSMWLPQTKFTERTGLIDLDGGESKANLGNVPKRLHTKFTKFGRKPAAAAGKGRVGRSCRSQVNLDSSIKKGCETDTLTKSQLYTTRGVLFRKESADS